MAYVISDKCTVCGKCKDVCPVEAISKGGKHYMIDAETCVSCGQCVDACEAGAIAEE
ncbi:MAG: 4Fe-4S binding protein [Kiritimatiellae bacterium]|nr:4Fe-4S binding protein [Kiritimatiellia bacterium]